MNAAARGGRRMADRSARRRPDLSALTALALVVAAGLALGLTRGERPAEMAGGTDGALVDRTQLSCPTSGLEELSGGGVRTTDLAGLLAVDEDGDTLGDAGVLTSGLVGEEPTPLDLSRGELADLDDPADGPLLDAGGERAAGLFGFRIDRSVASSAVGACVAPRASWWFTGVGADLDHSSELVLTNLDPGPAVVDLRVFGTDGPVDTVGTRGLTVAPGETVTVSLADVAPQSPELMVNVQASRGRVAVAASDRFAVGPRAPVGTAWVSDASRPSRVVRLAGISAAATTKTLVVGNPSDSEALVGIEVAGKSGSFVPTDLDGVSVAPGAVETIDLADVLPEREAVAVRLRAQVPVVGSLRTATREDVAYADPTSPLTGPAVAPVLARARTTFQLTAGPTDAVAAVESFDDAGESTGTEQIEIPATATAPWRPPRDSAYAVVRVEQGDVFGAAVFDQDAGLSTVPLVSPPIRVRLPEVVPGPR
ncbi:MAG: DUF5719 family protein [Nocardioides sp.]